MSSRLYVAFCSTFFIPLARSLLISQILTYLKAIESQVQERLEFLKIVVDYEHYVPLNVPLESQVTTIKHLRESFWQRCAFLWASLNIFTLPHLLAITWLASYLMSSS